MVDTVFVCSGLFIVCYGAPGHLGYNTNYFLLPTLLQLS